MDDPSLDDKPEGKRWDPLGAANDQEADEELEGTKHNDQHCVECCNCSHSSEKLRALEEEHEVLISSLLSLTTHFAQVQFRLRQIVHAPLTNKENLLKSLEEFAFRGIPDAKISEGDGKTKQMKQKELLDQLKRQLKEFESYTFETNETVQNGEDVTSNQLLLNELCHHQVASVNSLADPSKIKEYLVQQLKTQVADLERFIKFLQNDVENKHCTCYKATATATTKNSSDLRNSIHMVKRAAALLQMFTVMQFGCGANESYHFRKNDLKTTMKVKHWGDMRARLQMIVGRILEIDSMQEEDDVGNYSSDTEDSSVTVFCKVKMTRIVRKHLATTLCNLMQHGLSTVIINPKIGQSVSLVPIMECFAKKSIFSGDEMHAWDLILEYYTLKNGEYYNTTPARKLSQSFNLDIIGNSTISNKQSFLSTIGNIIATHAMYKRSPDSHFKAFVCAALNCNKLVAWLKLIFQCKPLINKHYQPWSYAVQTGFQDTLQCLDVLTPLKFDLPVDLAIQQFQNIKDVFI